MTDHDDHREAGAGARRTPAAGPVVDLRDLPPADAAPGDVPASPPPIDSSLLGEGGLPPAAHDDTPRPDLGRPMHAVPASDAPADSDAPDMPEVIIPPTGGRIEPVPTPMTDTSSDRTADPMPDKTDDRTTTGAPPSRPAPRRRSGFWPMVLGGVVAAGLGGGAVWLAGANGPAGQAEAPTTLSPEAETAARAAAADAARFEIDSKSQALLDAARQAGTEAAQAAIDAHPQSEGAQTPAIDPAVVDDQGKRIAALESRVEQIEGQSAADGAQATADPASAEALSQVQSNLQQLSSRVDELAARPTLDGQAVEDLRTLASQAESTRQSITDTADQVQQRLQTVEGKADDLGSRLDQTVQRVDQTAKRVDGAAAIAALQSALVNGSDGQGAAAQLREAGVQPPQALTVPVPALTTLQHDYPDAARAGLRAALKARGEAGTGNGLVNFLRAQTGARSVAPRPGNDPDAILSRAGAAVDRGEIAAALTEIAALPPAAQTAMQGWTTAAKAWADAQSAIGTLKTTP